MIRQRIAPTLNPASIHPDLPRHQSDMMKLCPYLRLSVQRDLTSWSSYEADPRDERPLLRLLIEQAELIREARRERGPLVCHNIELHGTQDISEAKRLMEQPVWIARNLYAPVHIIVDRFWIGIGRAPGRGRSTMTDVPISYFMIRCAIPRRDRLIISPRPPAEMAALRAGSADDNHDVLAHALGKPVPDINVAWPELLERYTVPVQQHSTALQQI